MRLKITFILTAFFWLYFQSVGRASDGILLNAHSSNLTFIKNAGQLADTKGEVHPEIRYYCRTAGAHIYFKDNSIEYNFYRFQKKSASELSAEQVHELSLGNSGGIIDKMYLFRTDLLFEGAQKSPEIVAEKKGTVKRNFYLSHCPEGINDVEEFQEITYKNIYDNIDLKFYFSQGKLKYDFIVHPGGQAADIRLRYAGAEGMTLNENGDIDILTLMGRIKESSPVSYQAEDGVAVKSAFKTDGGSISFEVGPYDKNATLVIDPVVHWATYYNNNYSSDTWTRPVFGSDGSMYNVCYTYASSYTIINPGSGAWIDPTRDGSVDLVIVKFSPAHELVWATYYGGNNSDYLAGYTDYGKAIAIDGSDNIFVAGSVDGSTTTFPTLDPGSGAFYQSQTKIYGETSFMLKFNSSGQRIWATMFQHENANTNWSSIRINGIVAKGTKVYFTGQTYRSNNNDIPLRTLAGAYNNATYVGDQDAFIGRFTSAGVLEWCSYLNSGNTSLKAYSQGCDLAVDNAGNMFFIGRESYNSGNQKHYLLDLGFGQYYQATNAGDQDITITRFNSSMGISWSTYYGGSLQDIPSMVETDNSNNVIIVCRAVRSTNFPTYNPGSGAYYQSSKAANGTASDAGIIKFSNTGVRQWATYYGGGGTYTSGGNTYDAETLLSGTGVDASNNIYFSGSTQSPSFPTQNETGSYYSGTRNGESDAVFLKFNNAGVRQWSTYYGGSGTESLYSGKGAVGSNSCEAALVAFGHTSSGDFPTTNPGSPAFYENYNIMSNCNTIYYFTESSGSLSVAPTGASASPASVCPGSSSTLSVSGGSLGTGASWKWYSGSCGSTLVGTGSSVNVSPSVTTTYYVRAEGDCNTTGCASVTINVKNNSTAPTTLAASPSTVCSGAPTTLTASGGSLGTGASWQLFAGSCSGSPVATNASGIFNINPASSTTYYVNASGDCNTTGCASTPVTVNTNSVNPTSVTASPATLCSGGSSTLTVNGGSLGNGASWQLYTGSCGGTLIASNASGIFSVNPATTTTYYVQGSGTCNTTSCFNTTVTISSVSTAPASVTATPSTVCPGSSVTLTVNGGTLGAGAVWELFGGSCGSTLLSSNSTGTFTVTPSVTTTYFIRANGSCNTTACASATVNVNQNSSAPVSLSAVPAGICPGSSSTLTVSGGSLGTGANWLLYAGSCSGTPVASNTSGVFTVSPGSSTTYYAAASGTCNTTGCASANVTVNTLSTEPTMVTASPIPLCSGGNSTITISGGTLGTGAVWQLFTGGCNGTLISSNTTGVFNINPLQTTTYYVQASGLCNTTPCYTVVVMVNDSSVSPVSLTATPPLLCSNTPATLTVNGGSLGTGAVWNLYENNCSGTPISSGTTGVFSVLPTATTSYYVSASGPCNTTSCVSTAVTVSTVSTAPTSLSITPSQVCAGAAAVINVNGGSLGTGGVWELFAGTCGGTPIASNTSGIFTVTPTATTTYFVHATGDCDTTNCVSETLTLTPLPGSAGPITGPVSVCEGATNITYTVPAISDATTYNWSLPSGFSGSSTSNTIVISTSPGAVSGSISVYGSNACGSGAASTLYVTLNPLPVVSLSGFAPLCLNAQPILLTGGSPSGGTYSGTGVNNNVFNPYAAGTGVHIITYNFEDLNGCSAIASDTLVVLPLPQVSLNSIGNVCENVDTIVLNAGVPGGGYYFGDNINQGVFYPASAGEGTHVVNYVYTGSNGCSDTVQATIEVEGEITLSSDIPVSTVYIGTGTEITFTVTPSQQGTYQFFVGSAAVQSGSDNQLTYSSWNASCIVYVVLNASCTDSLEINVRPIPNAFNPFNSDGVNDIFMPHVDLTIINRWGQVLYQGNEGWDGKYNGHKVSAGTYFYIITINNPQNSEKFIKGTVTLVDK